MMIQLRTPLLLLLLILLTSSVQAADSYPLRKAVECHPRAGLPNFVAKLDAGEHVKIAYLGGSITAAPGWRVQSREWFQQQYPEAKIDEIHAAIGGTGSDLGVFRLGNDVLRHDPDLLFVEFAVNDGGADPSRIHQAMEGIVRQTWKADPTIDICFVYTLSEPVLANLRAGEMQRSASAMEELADHYEIPTIHFGPKVVELEAAGELVFKAEKPADMQQKPLVFSTDGVHPHVETGHRVYTETIARSWPAIRKASGQPTEHTLKSPLTADNWEQAKQVSLTPDMLHGGWKKLTSDDTLGRRFERNMPELYQAVEPGASLEFAFEGTSVAVFDILGPDGGRLQVKLDDREPALRNRIDGYCTYHRMSKLTIGSDLPAGRHTVKITLTPETIDKRNVLFERNRDDFDKNPEKYAGHTWYASSLLIIGEIVPAE